MSRLEWILTALLSLLVVIVGALLIIFWLQRSDAVEVNNFATETSAPTVHTARSAYALAEPVATAWASDARLISASGTWPQNSFEPDGANWSLLFYSSLEEATALISVEGDQATLIGPAPTDRQAELVGLDRWEVDSPAVMETALSGGGQDFIDGHENVEMALSLETNPELMWRAVFFAAGTGESLEILISPATGQIVSKN